MFTLSCQYCWHFLLCNLSNHASVYKQKRNTFAALFDILFTGRCEHTKNAETVTHTAINIFDSAGWAHPQKWYKSQSSWQPVSVLLLRKQQRCMNLKKPLLPLAGFWLVNILRQDAVPLAWLDGGGASWAQVQPTGAKWVRPAPWIQVFLFQGDFQKISNMDTRWTRKRLITYWNRRFLDRASVAAPNETG